jgi:hypothetical protein
MTSRADRAGAAQATDGGTDANASDVGDEPADGPGPATRWSDRPVDHLPGSDVRSAPAGTQTRSDPDDPVSSVEPPD